MNHGRFITGDFESRSLVKLPDVGPWRYSEDPSTQALCFAYSFGREDHVHIWHRATRGIPESPPPFELFERLRQGWLFVAHNAMFEEAMWTNVMVPQHGWPPLPIAQIRCSAAKAAYYCLPRGLEALCDTLGVENRKDPDGRRLIELLSAPQKLTKAETAAASDPASLLWIPTGKKAKPTPHAWNEDEVTIRENWEYCRQDVRAERDADLALPDIPARELRIWQMDQSLNRRGVACDVEQAVQAIKIAREEIADLNARLEQLTGIERGTMRAKVKAWLNRRVYVPDTQGETLDKLLLRIEGKGGMADVCEVIRIVREVNRSSAAKYQAVVDGACRDGTLKDLLMYCGAHTLRWTGKRVQPHNFPKGKIHDMELACEVIRTGDRELIRLLYGDVMEHLSHAARGVIVARPGKRLWVADFAAIEARVIFWLAGCRKALDVFALNDEEFDIYCDMASRIYRRRITKKNKQPRQLGKQSILGLGFGMGFCKFLVTLRKYRISFTKEQVVEAVGLEECRRISKWIRDPKGGLAQVRRAEASVDDDGMGLDLERDLVELVLCKYVVDLYRAEYTEIPRLWRDVESAAIAAVESPGERFACANGRLTWVLEGRMLRCELPSGGQQTYWDPEVHSTPMPKPYEKKLKKTLQVTTVDEKTLQRRADFTYGGELVENVVQHIARDLMADAMVRIDDHPTYENVLSVHDEAIAESDEDEGSQEEFDGLVSLVPEWAEGCPIGADGWNGHRYKKEQ